MAHPALCKYVLDTLLRLGTIRREHSILAVCAGEFDQALFSVAGLENATFTNIDPERGTLEHQPQIVPVTGDVWKPADAHKLPFENGSFDIAFVSDGLHHCRSPHKALTEMYRVARRAVIVVETRDSAAMRLGERLRLVPTYELNPRLLETRQFGGMNFGPIPNHIYRWTEREFEKTLRTFDPVHDIAFDYFHATRVPPQLGFISNAVGLGAYVAPRQGNGFGMVATPKERFSWLTEEDLIKESVRKRNDATPPRRKPRRHVLRSIDPWYGWPEDMRKSSCLTEE